MHLQPHSKELESGTVLGVPHIVILVLIEFAKQIHHITRASSLSLMVDADHNYGNALNVMRTVEELEAAGVSTLTVDLSSWSASLASESASKAF